MTFKQAFNSRLGSSSVQLLTLKHYIETLTLILNSLTLNRHENEKIC